MKQKLFPNIRRMTSLFILGIFCVTLSVLALRLTVFSEMAVTVPTETVSSMVEREDGYKINSKPIFPTAASKGDVFISNLEGNTFLINVDITLEENGKSILTTGFIKPGDSRDSVKLNPVGQELEDGLYSCVAEITAVDPDNLKPVSSAKENITIQIGDLEDEAEDETQDEDETEETTDEDEK
jgi:hypothetical protein